MCQSITRKHIKGTTYSLLFQDIDFSVHKSGLETLLQNLYKRKEMVTCQ